MADSSQIERVVVRMYRGILGDCFLIRIKSGPKWQHILIDCGVLQNVEAGDTLLAKLPAEVKKEADEDQLRAIQNGNELIKKIAEDVVVTTANKRIDLVVLTHEHYDHFSGFALAEKTFTAADVVIDRLWLAWTENPKDPQAVELHTRFDKGKQALALAAQLNQAMGASADGRLQAAAALAAFVGPIDQGGLAAGGLKSGRATIQMLKDKAGPQATRYLEPGEIVEACGLKAYVLGPPRSETSLKKDAPSKGEGKEVYLTSLDTAMAVESTILAHPKFPQDDDEYEDAPPFARPHLQKGEPSDEKKKLRHLYDNDDAKYRRIDGDWTAAVESLALKMDSDTNNTSLVLAFELPDGQVLLFPGDAQVGNWLSWDDQTYPPKAKEGDPPPVTLDNLLRRVTFYKVGHHASHNATLRQEGLEKMTSGRLTAAIPVVQAVATIQGPGRKTAGKGWKMPYPDLYAELLKRTEGRIVRGDGDPAKEGTAFKKAPTDRDRPVTVSYEPSGLWVELIFPLS